MKKLLSLLLLLCMMLSMLPFSAVADGADEEIIPVDAVPLASEGAAQQPAAPIPLSVTAASRSWDYDGEEHRCHEYTVTGLLDEDNIAVSFSENSVITETGSCDNVIVYVSITSRATGLPVKADKYIVTLMKGMLTVNMPASNQAEIVQEEPPAQNYAPQTSLPPAAAPAANAETPKFTVSTAPGSTEFTKGISGSFFYIKGQAPVRYKITAQGSETTIQEGTCSSVLTADTTGDYNYSLEIGTILNQLPAGNYALTVSDSEYSASCTFRIIENGNVGLQAGTLRKTDNLVITVNNIQAGINTFSSLAIRSADGQFIMEGDLNSLNVHNGDAVSLIANSADPYFTDNSSSIVLTLSAAYFPYASYIAEIKTTGSSQVSHFLSFSVLPTLTVLHGSSSPAQPLPGDTVTVTADSPDEGKVFDAWTVADEALTLSDSSSASLTFTMPNHDVSLTASYRDRDPILTVVGGQIWNPDGDSVPVPKAGDSVYVVPTIPEGKVFLKWVFSVEAELAEGSTLQSRGIRFLMPTEDLTLTAVCIDSPAVITPAAGIPGVSYDGQHSLVFIKGSASLGFYIAGSAPSSISVQDASGEEHTLTSGTDYRITENPADGYHYQCDILGSYLNTLDIGDMNCSVLFHFPVGQDDLTLVFRFYLTDSLVTPIEPALSEGQLSIDLSTDPEILLFSNGEIKNFSIWKTSGDWGIWSDSRPENAGIIYQSGTDSTPVDSAYAINRNYNYQETSGQLLSIGTSALQLLSVGDYVLSVNDINYVANEFYLRVADDGDDSPLTWTVSFNYHNHGHENTEVTVSDGNPVTEPETPTDTNYDFAGWYSDSAYTHLYVFSTPVESDLTLHAKWTAKTYYPSISSTLTVPDDCGYSTVAEIQAALHAKAREDFEARYDISPVDGDMWDRELILYSDSARHNRVDAEDAPDWVYQVTVAYSAIRTQNTLNPNQNGFDYLLHQLTQDGTIISRTITPGANGLSLPLQSYYPFTVTVMPAELVATVRLEGSAQVGQTVTAAVQTSNNTGDFHYQWMRDGAAISSATSASYEISVEDLGKTLTCEISSSVQRGNVTLSAGVIGESQYTVSFDLNGLGTPINSQNVQPGDTATKPADPSAANHIFGGWYVDAEYKTEFDFTTPIHTNTVIYARWLRLNATGSIAEADRAKLHPKAKTDFKKQWDYTADDDISFTDYEIKLYVYTHDQRYREISSAAFPEDGVTINLKYPAETGATGFNFMAHHLLSSGNIESMKLTLSKNAISFKASSLSPFTLSSAPAKLSGEAKIRGIASVGNELTVTIDLDNNTGLLYYQWYRWDGKNASSIQKINGATSSVYVPVSADQGRYLVCVITSSVQTGQINVQSEKIAAEGYSPRTADPVHPLFLFAVLTECLFGMLVVLLALHHFRRKDY